MTEKSYVKCSKCGADAHKVYDIKEIEEKYKDDITMQVLLKRQYICSNIECSYQWEISIVELTRAFIEMRKDEGKSIKDISTELNTLKMDDEMVKDE